MQIRERLLSLIREAGHLTTGFLGTPWLLGQLPQKEAWELLLREDVAEVFRLLGELQA